MEREEWREGGMEREVNRGRKEGRNGRRNRGRVEEKWPSYVFVF